ncbi:MAG TPA: hypothetical protein VKZ95_07985 [Sphingobacteriaceae bacterium]|nr:hypothetical protein [Sphingobacteriaceae bacterium]
MKDENKTHWKKAFNSNYLGAVDLPGYKDIVATIKEVRLEVTKGTKEKEKKNIAYFAENIKPMILNVENSKTVRALAGGSNFLEDWNDVKVQIYVKEGVQAFGTVTDALRIRNHHPKQKLDTSKALQDIRGCRSKEELRKMYLSLDKSIQSDPEIIKLKDELKISLP